MTWSQRPLHAAVLGVATLLIGFAVTAAYLGPKAHAYEQDHDRATTIAAGVVVEDGIGDAEDIRVRWVDRRGNERVQRFGVYATDRYIEGAPFAVAYDPADPGSRAFPADPGETSAEDDLVGSLVLAGALTVLLLSMWALRGLLFWRAARRAVQPMKATALAGQIVGGGALAEDGGAWVALSQVAPPQSAGRGSPMRWQKVMWHPALNTDLRRIDVLVHGDPAGRRRVVIEWPEGVRLVPIGRLRRRPPTRAVLTDRADARADLAHSFVPRSRWTSHGAHPWWRRGVVLAAVGASIGAAAGVLIIGTSGILPLAAGFSAVVVNTWASNGAEP